MKFVLSLVVIALLFIIARTVAYTYFPEHTFLVGWMTGTLVLVIGEYFE